MSAIPATPLPANPPRSGVALKSTLLVLAIALIVLIARSDLYSARSDVGYWLGVVGGLMMAILLLYPLSKRARALRNVIPLRYWFAMHMMLGVLGPVLILLHCTLRIGSTNAAVAFWSMVVVASSGFVGRFAYRRLHAGLYGRQRSFEEVSKEAELLLGDASMRVAQAPALLAELRAFAAHADSVSRAGFSRPLALLALGPKARRSAARCHALVTGPERVGMRGNTPAVELSIKRYLVAACDAAQYRAYERVFSLWHVLHIPLVGILVLSAVFHVIAVHMY
ncbi:MAG TPA: hypothetical protein PKC03_10620 [Dokdonella sp.]|nr:hypothetical protein [Dokdonella sp.]